MAILGCLDALKKFWLVPISHLLWFYNFFCSTNCVLAHVCATGFFQSLFNVQIAREAYKHTLCVNMWLAIAQKIIIHFFVARFESKTIKTSSLDWFLQYTFSPLPYMAPSCNPHLILKDNFYMKISSLTFCAHL